MSIGEADYKKQLLNGKKLITFDHQLNFNHQITNFNYQINKKATKIAGILKPTFILLDKK